MKKISIVLTILVAFSWLYHGHAYAEIYVPVQQEETPAAEDPNANSCVVPKPPRADCAAKPEGAYWSGCVESEDVAHGYHPYCYTYPPQPVAPPLPAPKPILVAPDTSVLQGTIDLVAASTTASTTPHDAQVIAIMQEIVRILILIIQQLSNPKAV